MALACPRCKQEMVLRRVHPTGAARSLEIDACGRCGGLWLDKGEAAVVFPTVAYLERRHIEITALGKPGGALSRCPRCAGELFEFSIIGVLVDYCGGCNGVWLDAEDHTGFTRGLDQAADQARGSPYRALEQVASAEQPRCVGCGAEARLGDMYVSFDGLACRRCYFTALAKASR
jgi:Zn-finger nucleic acid-binding protein